MSKGPQDPKPKTIGMGMKEADVLLSLVVKCKFSLLIRMINLFHLVVNSIYSVHQAVTINI